jgi:hypothetical protein
MPVVSKAGNRVTWNHFLFWASHQTAFSRKGAKPQRNPKQKLLKFGFDFDLPLRLRAR